MLVKHIIIGWAETGGSILSTGELIYKLATEPREFEAIYRLNYETFVHEIPQHSENPEGRLVDKFDAENTYCIGLRDDQLVGMVCLRGNRPFSLDHKVPDLDSYLPQNRRICEFRLLAVRKEFRNTKTTTGLLKQLAKHALSMRFDCAVISGTTRQLKLYRHIGFTPFGPLVGSGEAMYQPMFLTLEAFERHSARLLGEEGDAGHGKTPVNLLPGPVSVAPEVTSAFQGTSVSHRSIRFVSDLKSTKRYLCDLVNAKEVEIMLGSGTMANDVIASQLSLEDMPGLILSNGEFGERLVDHAQRHRLSFNTLKLEWGAMFTSLQLKEFMDRHWQATWLWAVHCETSTGVLNDVTLLGELCGERGIKLCLDAISSIGVVPVDLRNVYFASGVSGKGLASYPGVSLVFYNHHIQPSPHKLPRYLDLGHYSDNEGIPFTQSSNLVYALKAAVESQDWSDKFNNLVNTSSWLRRELRALGYTILANDETASTAVITLVLPDSLSSRSLGWQLEQAGFLLSYRSEYLLRRNWVQICLMGAHTREGLSALLAHLEQKKSNDVVNRYH